MNSVVNKYLLHNRSTMLENDQDVGRFFYKREIENRKKHKQPSTLNVKVNLEKLPLDDMQVFRFNFRHQIDKKILHTHGGLNALQPSSFHWRLLDKIILSTLYEVVLLIYPKTPEFHIDDTFQAIQCIYDRLISEVEHQNVAIMGDGSGGALALFLVQSLLDNQQPLPNKLYLISPILDAILFNRDISDALIEQDAVLSQFGVNKVMKEWANGLPLTDKRTLPINGTMEGLSSVYTFGGGREVTRFDMKLLEQMTSQHHQYIELYDYPKTVHDFPIYPTRQSCKVTKQIAKLIDEDVTQNN